MLLLCARCVTTVQSGGDEHMGFLMQEDKSKNLTG